MGSAGDGVSAAHEVSAGRLREAGAAVTAVLRGNPHDVRALEALTDRLRWLAAGDDRDAEVPLLSERAQLRRALGDMRGTADDLDHLLAIAPAHVDALRRRADLAGDLGDGAAAAALWRRYLAVETDPSARADAEMILARTLAEDLGDVDGAIEQVERVIAQRPADLTLRERLVGLATQAGAWPRVARELREIARLRATPGDRAKDELRLGRVTRDHLGDAEEALAAFERGRQLDPLHLDLLREQVELAARAGRAAEAAERIAAGATGVRPVLVAELQLAALDVDAAAAASHTASWEISARSTSLGATHLPPTLNRSSVRPQWWNTPLPSTRKRSRVVSQPSRSTAGVSRPVQ